MDLRTLTLREGLLLIARLANHLAQRLGERTTASDAETIDPRAREFEPRSLLRLAVEEYRSRQRRRDYIRADFFGEPAWDMLLDLYAKTRVGSNVSVTSACIASGVPGTTALRYIGELQTSGYIVAIQDEIDQRRRWLKLTPLAVSSIERYLKAKASFELTGEWPRVAKKTEELSVG